MNINTIVTDCTTIKNLADKILRELSVNSYVHHRPTSSGFGSGAVYAPVFAHSAPIVLDDADDIAPLAPLGKPQRTVTSGEAVHLPVAKAPIIEGMMNRSILSVCNLTEDERVRDATAWLIAHRDRMCIAEFVKADGSTRTMRFLPRNEYNELFGIPTTEIGRRIVRTKVNRDMIVVTEVCDDNRLQARTINLRKLNWLRLAA